MGLQDSVRLGSLTKEIHAGVATDVWGCQKDEFAHYAWPGFCFIEDFNAGRVCRFRLAWVSTLKVNRREHRS